LPEFPDECGELPSSLVLYLSRQGRVVSWLDDSATGLTEVVIESPDPWSQLNLTPEQIQVAVAPLLGPSRKIQEDVLLRLVERSKTDPLRRYRLSLDAAMGFAVRQKWEETVRGELLSHTVCEEFFQLPNRDLWLPKVCRVLTYASEHLPSYISTSPLYETTTKLNGAVARMFSRGDFELWYDVPGGRVFDYTAEGATVDNSVQYKVPSSASDLAAASKATLSRTRWLVIINLSILALIAICLIYRKTTTSK
jgi:hypothetical protein